jgi:hypothetical protein
MNKSSVHCPASWWESIHKGVSLCLHNSLTLWCYVKQSPSKCWIAGLFLVSGQREPAELGDYGEGNFGDHCWFRELWWWKLRKSPWGRETSFPTAASRNSMDSKKFYFRINFGDLSWESQQLEVFADMKRKPRMSRVKGGCQKSGFEVWIGGRLVIMWN